MEVWKIVFHSIFEIFHSIPFWHLPYSIPKFPFHSIPFSIPFLAMPCRKVRELCRTLSNPQNHHDFSMDEFQAGLAIFFRAGSDRDNFTELENRWLMGDSEPFYRAVMLLNRFKCFFRCIRFDIWHTREQQ